MGICKLGILGAILVSSLAAQDIGWLGTWKLSSVPGIEAAIEGCTAEMSFFKRPIARSRLKKLNPAYQRVLILRSGTDYSIQFDERQPIQMPADGRAIPWIREDGEKFMVSIRATSEALVQHYQGEDGERDTCFRVDDAGKAMVLEVTVKSQKLPKPLVYTLRYTR